MKYDYEKRKEMYDRGLEKWGYIAQFDQTIEEMSELTKAICKYKRQLNGEYSDRPDIKENLIEELADVYMCIEFLTILLGKDDYDKMLDEKLDKFLSQIENPDQIVPRGTKPNS